MTPAREHLRHFPLPRPNGRAQHKNILLPLAVGFSVALLNLAFDLAVAASPTPIRSLLAASAALAFLTFAFVLFLGPDTGPPTNSASPSPRSSATTNAE